MSASQGTDRLIQALNTIDDGRSILVLGAGFSMGAINADNEKMPSANKLASILAEKIGEDDETGLEEISGLYLEDHSRADLLAYLKGMFTCVKPTHAQAEIANAPWRRIYTTNYDNVVEKSQKKLGLESLTRTSDPRTLTAGPCCVHLNGFIETSHEGNFDAEIMLTDVQYFTNELRDSPWAAKLRSDFHSARNIFFVGYSLYDFDISKLLFESAASRKKIFFIQHDGLKKSQKVKFERFGELHRIGIDEFASLIERRAQSIDDSLKHGFLSNFREEEFHEIQPRRPSIEAMRPFLTKGTVDLDCLSWDIAQGKEEYRVERPAIEIICPKNLPLGSTVIVSGDIGSGKKIFLEEVVLRFSQEQFRCFRFDGLSEDLSDDIEFLSHASERDGILIVFPDYYNHEILINLVRAGVPKAILITTSTIAALELSRTKPFEGDSSVIAVSLETLSAQEISAWDKLLDSNALWGDNAGKSEYDRQKFIKVNCRARQRDLLLFLFDQEAIKEEIKSVFQDAKRKGEESSAQLVKYLAISSSNHDPSFSEVQEILGLKFARVLALGRARWTYELLALEEGRRKVTSSIFAQYLLREFVADREIIDELSELALQLDHAAQGNKNFSKLKNFPMRYAFIERIFSEKGKREKLVEYYEALRQNGVGLNNPQFWLQYAIARMSFEDYPIARDLFDTAYAKSERMTDYDTYQIDNHYARFLIESSVKSGDWETSRENFRKAHCILTKQMASQKQGHYPFRVACGYLDFVERYERDMTNDDLNEFVTCCREIKAFLLGVPEELHRNTYVRKCDSRIPRAIEYAEEVIFGS